MSQMHGRCRTWVRSGGSTMSVVTTAPGSCLRKSDQSPPHPAATSGAHTRRRPAFGECARSRQCQPNPCKALRRNIEILTAMLECLEDGEVVASQTARSGSLYRRRLARAVRQVAEHEFAHDRCGSAMPLRSAYAALGAFRRALYRQMQSANEARQKHSCLQHRNPARLRMAGWFTANGSTSSGRAFSAFRFSQRTARSC
jgi:hypothetical protein